MIARCAAPGLSYSVDTLTEHAARVSADRSLCLLLGMDAFLGLPHWHRWRELLDLGAHRGGAPPGWRAPTTGPLGEVMVDHGTGRIRDAAQALRAGRIYVHAGTQLEISSTELRALLVAGRDPRYLVPDEVREDHPGDEVLCFAAGSPAR